MFFGMTPVIISITATTDVLVTASRQSGVPQSAGQTLLEMTLHSNVLPKGRDNL